MPPLRRNPHLQLTPAQNQAAHLAAARFVAACADYRALLASKGLPIGADFVQPTGYDSAHPDLLLPLTHLELDRLLSLRHWPNGLPLLSLPELATHYGLDFGRLLDTYTPAQATPDVLLSQWPGYPPSWDEHGEV